MSASSTQEVAKKPAARSRVTNGSKLGDDMDGRSVWARRLRDLISLYSSDVSSDDNTTSEATKSLIRRAAVLTVELERSEAVFAKAGSADPSALNAYQTTANSLRRLLESLHIRASVKDVKDVVRTIEGKLVMKNVASNMSEADLAVCYGSDSTSSKPTPG